MKENTRKTLTDAVEEHHHQKAKVARPRFGRDIAHHTQFSWYIRDFLADNPDQGMDGART